MFGNEAVRGGGPWGAGTLAGPDGSRQPSEQELEQAVFQVGVLRPLGVPVSVIVRVPGAGLGVELLVVMRSNLP